MLLVIVVKCTSSDVKIISIIEFITLQGYLNQIHCVRRFASNRPFKVVVDNLIMIKGD